MEAGRRAVRRRDRQRRAEAVPALTARAWSPSALQQYARCPYRFALRGIFGLRPAERPVGIQRMDPATRGQIYHEVQFELLRDLAARELLPVRPENLVDALERLDDALRTVTRARRRSSRPPSRRSGDSEVQSLRADLRGWLQQRAATEPDWTPEFYELSFGLKDPAGRDPRSRKDPVEIGGGFRLQGLDRPGGAARERRRARGGSQDRPRPGAEARKWSAAAKCCSRVLYALAAEKMLGEPVSVGRLYYSTIAQNYAAIDVPLNDWSRRRAAQALEIIDAAMRDGFLPAAPRKDGCKRCEYLPVCGPYEEERVAREVAAGVEGLEGTAGVAMSTPASRTRPELGGRSLRGYRQDHRAGRTASSKSSPAGTPVETIVAVTFTHAAAGNMKLRVRHELEQRRAQRARSRRAGAPRRRGALARPRLHRHHPRLLRATAAPPSGRGGRRSGVPGTRAARRAARLRRRLPALDRTASGVALAGADARPGAARLARDATASRSTSLRIAAWSLAEWRDFDAPWDKRGFDRDARLDGAARQGRSHARSAQSRRGRATCTTACSRSRVPGPRREGARAGKLDLERRRERAAAPAARAALAQRPASTAPRSRCSRRGRS